MRMYWARLLTLSHRHGILHLFDSLHLQKSTAGRWLTMDAADLDGDSDVDIVLGNAKFPLGAVPPVLMKKWEAHSPSILILRNAIRR